MLLVDYCFGIRSERRLCEEVHLNLAYRWFCRLDLSDRVPDHSTFSKNRHGRFRDSALLRHLFEVTVARCIEEGLVSGQRMAVDASLIEADANKQNSTPKEEWDAARIDPAEAPRAVREYLDTLDEAAFGAASEVQPKFTSHSEPASQWTAARKGPAFFSYSDNYLIDTDHGVIVDVEATRSIRQAEVGSTKTMLERVKARFDLHPQRLIADTAYGTGHMLGWLVDRKIAPHIPVFDKSGRSDGTWSRADFEWDAENDQYICPEGHQLKQFRRNYSDPNRGPTGKGVAKYRDLKLTCQACPSKPRCCPNMDFRSITREEYEDARQIARDIAKRHLDEAPEEGRDALRAPQAHPWPQKAPNTRAMWRKRRIPPRRHGPEPPETGKDPSCTAASTKRLTGKAPGSITSTNILRSRTGVFPQNGRQADRCGCGSAVAAYS
jgi:IS5 family transposase